MMRGVITKIFPNQGYGFVRGEDGHLRFMHANDVVPVRAFDTMHEGMPVEFKPIDIGEQTRGKGNGLRAIEIRAVAA
jgi:cold shock CspA family protein